MTTVMDELVKTEDLLALVKEETGKEAELDSSIESLGVDSLEFISLMQAVELKFGVKIPDQEFANLNTLRDIRKLL